MLEKTWVQVNVNNLASGRASKDLSYIIYFNYNKKGHYSDKYVEDKKDQNISKDFVIF